MPIVLADFVRTVPQPLTAALVKLAPSIAVARNVLEITSWRQSSQHAWLAVALWWALCLSVDTVLRYLLPFLVFAVLSIAPRPRGTPVVTTEQSLQAIVTDLQAVHSLLPAFPPLPAPRGLPIRILATLYLPYLLLTYLVPLRILVALLGTLALFARAPFARIIVAVFLRSAWCRFALRYVLSFITGAPLPPVILSQQPTTTSSAPVPELRFLFTIYENQRWWMGLDWTAALLPNERPSWCSSAPAHTPVSPPSAFALPSPSTIYLSNGKGKRVKRTAIWRWEEPEWKVLIRTDTGRLSRVDRPIPDDTPPAATSSGSKLLKAAGRMRESGLISGGITGNTNVDDERGFDGGPPESEEEDIPTDPDGWIYGDNKWEGLSGKGGIGKYTRQRRWTRVAVVYEMVELVEDGPTGVEIVDSIPEPKSTTRTDSIQFTSSPDQEAAVAGMNSRSPGPEEESPLRQRLRRALSKQ